jgi:AraC family transcriptional regulator of adaptative response / DNA-3-methyladenine glycosylase II
MPRARGRSVAALATAGVPLDPGADRDELRARLLALPGIGPWTADYLQMRATGDPDVLLASDLAVRNSADDLGLDLSDRRPDWAPWRSYATHHLWMHLYGHRWVVAA